MHVQAAEDVCGMYSEIVATGTGATVRMKLGEVACGCT